MSQKNRTLKHAPLVEVIFELKWKLQQASVVAKASESGLILSHQEIYDPGFLELVNGFESGIKKLGFKHGKTINPPLPYQIRNRYYLKEDRKFPLLQIGQGIFAANADSHTYEWPKFKALVLKGVETVQKNYPGKLQLTNLELRYVNVFDPKFLSSTQKASFSRFINSETNAKLELPKFTFGKMLGSPDAGRLILQQPLKDKPDSKFILDIASAKHESLTEAIRLESKVVSGFDLQKGLLIKGKLTSHVSKWLDNSRTILSPFFEEFLSQSLLKKLGGK